MVRRALRSRSLRKIKIKLPGGASIVHYFKRKPSGARCASCGAKLHGIAREMPKKMKNVPKSKKTNSRPYGGNLCSECMRKKVKEKLK